MRARRTMPLPPLPPSAFWKVFGVVLEEMASSGLRPVVVGEWAAVAHGYIHGAPSLTLVIRTADRARLFGLLGDRGAAVATLPATVGLEPWRIDFVESYGGVAGDALRTTDVAVRWGNVEVLDLASLIDLGAGTLSVHTQEALRDLAAGHLADDDGERGADAWDVAGRLTAGAAATHADGTRHHFVDFRGIP